MTWISARRRVGEDNRADSLLGEPPVVDSWQALKTKNVLNDIKEHFHASCLSRSRPSGSGAVKVWHAPLPSASLRPARRTSVRRSSKSSSTSPGGWWNLRLSALSKAAPDIKDHAKRAESIEYGRASSTWARLIAKIYGVDPLICPRCGNNMRVLAIITDPSQVDIILRHLIKIGRAPLGLILAALH